MDGIEVNTDPELDPLFGDIEPQDPDVMWVNVTPKAKSEAVITDYFFILILPTMEEKEKTDVIQDIMEMALNPGDSYSVKAVTESMSEAFELTTPILSFDQKYLVSHGDLRIVWLRPPKKLMQ